MKAYIIFDSANPTGDDYIIQQFNKLGHDNYELIDVSNGDFQYTYDDAKFKAIYGRSIRPEELLKNAVHQSIYRKIIEKNEHALIVSADNDIIDEGTFTEIINSRVDFDFNVIFLNEMINNNDWYRSPLFTNQSQFINAHKCIKVKLWNNVYDGSVFDQIHWWVASAYIISSNGAKKGLEANHPISNVVDAWFNLNVGESVYKINTPIFKPR